MAKQISRTKLKQIRRRLKSLYGDQVNLLEERFIAMVGRYGVGESVVRGNSLKRWDHHDVLLITYGDTVLQEEEIPLTALKQFCTKHLKGAINIVHLLPFYPWSSDDGFSVIDYRQVDEVLGDWKHVEDFRQDFDLMFDLVLNHCSKKSQWFRDFLVGISPGKHYFLEMDPETDLSQVVRPRTSPLLTKTSTRFGDTWVWTTFSEDQVDLNWQNPDLLFEFLDILFWYISKGLRIIRMDAVAFIWKNLETNCIHQPQTHQIVKLIRDVCELVAPHVILLTETNVPHAENISYFGKSDEAHMVYNFSLPPLLLQALLAENTQYLADWAEQLVYPGRGCTYLNFSASHDGIGVRPLEGLLPQADFDRMIEAVEERGGVVSKKKNSDGSDSPYELNITYASALSIEGDEALGLRRMFCSQAVVLAFKGVPAIYFQSLFAAGNDYAGYEDSGIPRRLNRKKWQVEDLNALIKTEDNKQGAFFHDLIQLLRRRNSHPAFHPDGKQIIHRVSDQVFAIERISPLANETVLCLFNFSREEQFVERPLPSGAIDTASAYYDIASGKNMESNPDGITLTPFETLWLIAREV